MRHFSSRYRRYIASLFSLWTLGFYSCGSPAADFPHPDKIERKIAGRMWIGRFVSPYSYEWFIRAELYVARGQDALAVEAYRRALAGPEEDSLVLARLAETLGRLRKWRAAEQMIERAIALDPNSEPAWLARAEIAKNRGNDADAIAAYHRAEKAAPDSAVPPLELAALLAQRGNSDQAQQVLERFARCSSGDSVARARVLLALAIYSGDFREVLRALNRLQSVQTPRPNEIRVVISLALERADFELASRLFKRLPRRLEDNGLRLRALLGAGRINEAEALLSLDPPQSFGDLAEVASAYFAINRPAKAGSTAEMAMISRRNPNAYLIGGRANIMIGNFSKAIGYLTKIKSGHDAYQPAVRAIELAQYLSYSSQVYSADIAPAVSSSSLKPSIKGEILKAIAELELARHSYRRAEDAAKCAGSDLLGTLVQAEILERTGKTRQAIELYLSLGSELTFDYPVVPNTKHANRETENGLVRARVEQKVASGDLKSAIDFLRIYLRTNPDDWLAQLRLAELLAQTGQTKGAVKLAQRIVPVVREWPAIKRLSHLLR
jgi:tetratricopeptide (TPR) repeat protein